MRVDKNLFFFFVKFVVNVYSKSFVQTLNETVFHTKVVYFKL